MDRFELKGKRFRVRGLLFEIKMEAEEEYD